MNAVKSFWAISCVNAELKSNVWETDCLHHRGLCGGMTKSL
jgi:hypothetical protein